MSWKDTYRQLPSAGFSKNDPPPLDWLSPVCPSDRPGWRAVNLSRMTWFFWSQWSANLHACYGRGRGQLRSPEVQLTI